LVPRAGNYSEIQDLAQNIFQQNELKKRELAIADEAASVEIINASGDEKLASKIKALLTARLGVKNVKLTNSQVSQIQEQTTINDKSSGQKLFTLDELIKKIPATLASQAPQETQEDSSPADLVLTLGSDLENAYSFDEASIDDFNKAQDSQDTFDFTQINN
jgi:ribosomal protein S6